jgi:phosphoglycolate phosphatase-like HAD superfamily hydrolase
MPRLELLIWDFNGVMLDDLAMACGSVEYIFRLYDKPVPSRDRYRNEISARFMEFYRGHGVPPWASTEDLNVIRRTYYLARLPQVRFRPELRSFLGWCRTRGLKLAVCSAEIKAILDALVDRDALRELFEPEGIRAEAWNGKAVELRALCERMNIAPAATAYVDDTADGVRAAAEAGVRSIGWAHPTSWNASHRIEAAKPAHIVHDFRELKMVLEALTR